jgi:glycosyltransferase involved in cell wall biosynthesis
MRQRAGQDGLVKKLSGESASPLVIAAIMRPQGMTGEHTYVRQLLRCSEKNGLSATLLTPFSWARALAGPVFGFRYLLEPMSGTAGALWYRYWHEVFLRKALRKHLSHVDDVVIYAQDPLAARAAMRARRTKHQPVIMAVHFEASTADEWVSNKRIRAGGAAFRTIRRQERQIVPKVDGIVYVSKSAREMLLRLVPQAASVRSVIIHPSIAPVEPAHRLKPLGDLVTVGRLEHLKNHQFLLKVLAEVKRAGSSLTLDVFGEGPCRRGLVDQARSLGLEDEVRFHGYRPDVRSLLPGYRVYVHAAVTESCGLAVLEAMAAGLPVVAANVGGISELCDQNTGACFWPLDDPVQAAAVLLDLLGSEKKRAQAAASCLARARRDFDEDVLATLLWSFVFGTSRRPDWDGMTDEATLLTPAPSS